MIQVFDKLNQIKQKLNNMSLTGLAGLTGLTDLMGLNKPRNIHVKIFGPIGSE